MTSVALVPKQNEQVDFGGLMQLCEALVPTGFLPDHIKTAGQAAAIVLAGQELGMSPMVALRSIVLVKGKVVVSADAQLALFKSRGGRAVFESLTDNAAILKLVHPNGDTHTEAFTMADAKRAGLTNNPTWSKYPKAMLRSRVITAGLKSVGFEPTAGAYDPEEMQSVTATVAEGENGENPTVSATSPDSDTTDEPERTVEWARNFLIPAGPLEGQKLGVCGAKQLSVFLEWADGKISEAGDDADEALLHFRVACALLLESKAASTSVKVPEPGKVEDALVPNEQGKMWEPDGWKTLPRNVIAEDPNSPLPF